MILPTLTPEKAGSSLDSCMFLVQVYARATGETVVLAANGEGLFCNQEGIP